jgi:hypothetical protein
MTTSAAAYLASGLVPSGMGRSDLPIGLRRERQNSQVTSAFDRSGQLTLMLLAVATDAPGNDLSAFDDKPA